MEYIKVKEDKSYCRDMNSNAIINVDSNSYNEYIKNKNRVLQEKQRIQNLENEVNDIKNSLNDIKSLLVELINK
jgi:hypothetical protein